MDTGIKIKSFDSSLFLSITDRLSSLNFNAGIYIFYEEQVKSSNKCPISSLPGLLYSVEVKIKDFSGNLRTLEA